MSVISINNRLPKTSPVAPKFLEFGRRCKNFAQSLLKYGNPAAIPARAYRAVTEEAIDLIQQDDPYLVNLGEIGRRVKERLDACKPTNICNVVGCPRCAKRRVLERTEQLCNQAFRFREKTPRSMLLVIGIGCQNWTGDIDSGKVALAEDMGVFSRKVLRRMSVIKGFSLNLDAKPMTGDTHIDTLGRDGVLEREQTGWHLHIHGTLAVYGEGKERYDTVLKQLEELCGLYNLPFKFHLEELRDDKPKQGLPGETLLIKTDKYCLHGLANWNTYAMKTLAGEAKRDKDTLLSADGFRVLQRHLVGCQLEWAGGVFARKESALKPLSDARGCIRWFEDINELFQDFIDNPQGLDMSNVDAGMLKRNLKDLTFGKDCAEQLLKHLTLQRATFVRQKRRRRRRIEKLKSKYTGRLLESEIAKVNRRAARDKAKANQAYAARQDIIDLLWADVKQAVERVFKRTARIIAELNPKEINRRVMAQDLIGTDRMQAALSELSAAGLIYALRRKVRDLTAGARLLARHGVQDGTDERALDRAVELSMSLERWNSVWPCWLSGESIRKLDWAAWWGHWHERHFMKVCWTV